MLKVGLTGSIAVGKSFVLGVLAELGCHVWMPTRPRAKWSRRARRE